MVVARALKPVLVLILGLPGAGKSALAHALCRRPGWARVDRDAMRAAMFPRGRAAPAEKVAANAAVWRAAGVLLRRRRSVVIDGMTFAALADRRRGRQLARRCGARCVELFLDCPVPLARARIAGGAPHPAPDREPALVDEVARRFAPAPRGARRLDARLPRRELLRRALRTL